jgi:hypothetical protein
LIFDQSFYKEGLIISAQLITQFDKNRIREELINLYQGLMVEKKGYHQLLLQ